MRVAALLYSAAVTLIVDTGRSDLTLVITVGVPPRPACMPHQPSLTTPSRWKALSSWLTSCWRDPNATPEQNAIFRGRQFHFVTRLIPMSVIPSMLLLFAGIWWFWNVGDRATMLTLLSIQLLSGTFSMVQRQRRRRQPRGVPVTDTAVWVMALNLGVAALTWSVLTVHLFGASNLDQRVILLSVIGAVLTCGSWFYAVLPQVGLTWTFTMSIGLMDRPGADPVGKIPGLALAAAVLHGRVGLDRADFIAPVHAGLDDRACAGATAPARGPAAQRL